MVGVVRATELVSTVVLLLVVQVPTTRYALLDTYVAACDCVWVGVEACERVCETIAAELRVPESVANDGRT
jgi:hypothetical protein